LIDGCHQPSTATNQEWPRILLMSHAI
jgi:hypothetical protein